MELMDHQLEVIDQLDSGKVLLGEVGVGKSAAALGYYCEKECPRDIYVITTAKKRDSGDWEREAASFGIGVDRSLTLGGVVTVDSWNNIRKYEGVTDAFFIFDEQRAIGYGTWSKTFITIARQNRWLMLSATPGDTWMDYAPIFIANGFYKHMTDFKHQHVLYKPFFKFPVIEGYLNERKLELHRNDVLVEMQYLRPPKQFLNFLPVAHDEAALRDIRIRRWHTIEDRPITDAAEMWRLMRRVVNSDPSRLDTVRFLMKAHPKLIIFYNFNYELEILRSLNDERMVAEWNGHNHDPLPDTDEWIYLVQYISGAEGWNCIETDSMILYSLSYSYKNFVQARGRIDRLDSQFTSLFYYIFVSYSGVDAAIRNSLDSKHSFNQKKFLESVEGRKLGF